MFEIYGIKVLSVNWLKRFIDWIRRSSFKVGFFSLIWLVYRTGTKPSRAVYPCQRAALANSYLWLTAYIIPLFFVGQRKIFAHFSKNKIIFVSLVAIIIGSAAIWFWSGTEKRGIDITLTERIAKSQPSSDIFIVNGTSGNDGGVIKLLGLMGSHGLLFYKSSVTSNTSGPNGLFANDDVILIKINCQWDMRGGTNTDLLKAIIQAIVDHPNGFTGEIIVADNGQGRGSLDWSLSNAKDHSQSAQKVVNTFSNSFNVSTFLWDTIRGKKVDEYYLGDLDDGYIINETVNTKTGIRSSYPKFKTSYGNFISFKMGIWDPTTKSYNQGRLKIINVPVLKTHSTYGVTASIKHYMGVGSQTLTNAHSTVGQGGMGTEIIETRFPVLNIIDAIWVNAKPSAGPQTNYADATEINVIAASVDPVALDYWGAKYILLQVAQKMGYSGTSSIDPDNIAVGSFGNWLRLSMEEMVKASFQTTIDESYMNVYIVNQ